MAPKHLEWLQTAVFYQIFPSSFYDSNGDGIGDIQGIIEKLDYIEKLGCNAVWLNPVYESSFRDAGYDIIDHQKVDPRFGTNNDLKKLFSAAQDKGIRICLDLVPGHTSIDHPDFKESCRADDNEYKDNYIWTDSAWTKAEGFEQVNGYAERDGNYICNFFHHQPSLNYGFASVNEEWQKPLTDPSVLKVNKELEKTIRFWLDMGADGFRVDMAFNLVKNDPDHKATSMIWKNIRKMMDKEYAEAVLISEWANPPAAVSAGFHVDLMLQTNPVYSSLFRSPENKSFFSAEGKGNILSFLEGYSSYLQKTKKTGFISLPTGSHDMVRLSHGRTKREIELAFVFLMTMPGIPFIYYGDEIGVKYNDFVTSKEGGYECTGSRTPMQWEKGKNSGFSSSDTPYLPADDGDDAVHVNDQLMDDTSQLTLVRNLIRLRKENSALHAGSDFTPLFAEQNKYPFVFMRSIGKNKVLIAVNPSGKPASASFKVPGSDAFVNLKMVDGIRLKENKGMFHLKMKEFSYGIFTI